MAQKEEKERIIRHARREKEEEEERGMGERALSDTRLSLPLFPFPPSDGNKEWKSGAGEESVRQTDR